MKTIMVRLCILNGMLVLPIVRHWMTLPVYVLYTNNIP